MSPEAHRLLRFALKYPDTYHTFSKGNPRKTRNALLRLEALGYVEIVRHNRPAEDQFRARIGSRQYGEAK